MGEEKKVKSRISQKNIYVNSEAKNHNPQVKSRIANKRRSVSGIGYFAGKAGLGALSVVEGAFDIIGGGIADLFGNDDYADYVFQYDTWVNDLNAKLDEGYKPKKVGKFLGDVSSGLGQSATFLIPYVGQILFVAGMWGNAVSSASQKTGKVGGREYIYGAGSAAVEWGLERFISGSGQTLETLGKQTAKNVGSKVVKSFGKTAAKTTTTKMVASQLVSSAAGEAVEEFLGSVWDPIWQRWSGVDDEAKVDWGDAAYSALVGLVSGGILGGVSTSVQTAYEGKRGADLNADAKKRDVLLKQARYLVDNAEAQGLTSGSDTVAGHLAELRGGLTSYQNAKDKNSAGAMIALGKIERTLVATELNVITEARVNYIASLSEAERDNLAEWANAYFKDAGVEITAKDLADIDNLVTRTIATMDWVGKIVDTTLGKNRVLNTEIAEAMARQTMSEKQLADEKKKATAQKESDRIMTEAKETAVSLDTAKWSGENASYFYEAGGERAYLSIEKNADGTYQAYMFDDEKFRPLNNLTAEQVTSLVDGAKNKLADATKGKNADEKNKRSKGEVTPTEKTENAESAEKRGESGTKTAEGVGETDETTTKSSLGSDPTVLEEGGAAKSDSEYVEKEFKATPDEVKRASKMVKEFKFLPAKQREAIIEMMRTAGNIDKLTVSSIAHFMASREGLNVRFMKNHVAEGSFDVLTKSGERLILLDPKYNNGKYYRADILAHELYHDIIAESSADAGKALNEMIHESVSPSLRREIADRYTKHFNGKSISEYLAEKNEKWTETNVKDYFKEYTKISYAEIMEEVSAGVMGKIVGQRAFIRQLRAKGLLARTFDHIRNICGAIANRAMTVGGDRSPGFTIAFRDALQFKALYSQAVIATNTDLTPALVTELKSALQSVAEFDEERARTKLSLSTTELIDKYPKLNLNQDISKLDGVPAIRLTDGSILHFTEPHVTFIQNNNIDVEDIASGGWISDGVYEASERSDTMRYKERMLAKKRMDEKRAVRGTKLSLGGDENYTEYNKPITLEDVETLRSIGKKSINAFTSEDIQKAQKWAYKFYKELGTKSPFFRAWFGEWRAQDTSVITLVQIDKYAEVKSGNAQNKDTGRKISWSKDVAREAVLNANKENKTDMAYIGANISKIVENAILFDTVVSDKNKNKKMDGTAFMHSFYSICNVDEKSILIKLFAEEAFSEKQNTSFTRAYTIKQIKKVAEIDDGVLSLGGGLTGSHSTTINSIAELLDFVKTYDAEFTSAPEVNPALLNEDGTPKVVYHGTKAGDFTVFDKDRIGSGATLFASQGKGFYFTENKDVASGYAKSGKVVNVYLKMNNALVFTDKNNNTVNNLIKGFAKQHGRDFNINEYSNYVDFEKRTGSVLSSVVKGDGEAFTAFLREKGYDGIIYTSYNYDTNKADKTYVVFDSEQIKSATNNIGTFDKTNLDTRYSLPMYPTLPDASNVEAELNERDWGFEWTDGKLLNNVKTVRAYIEKAYPDVAIAIEIDNKARRIAVTSVSRFNDFEERSEADQNLHDFLTSIGIKDEQIGPFLSSFEPSEKAKVAKTIKDMDKKPRPKVYYKNQIAKTTEGILSQIITPMAGGDAKMLGKDKKKLVTWLLRRMNTAENAEDRRKIARIVAEAFIARTVYADMDVNAEYETMLVDGTIETFEEVKSYLGKIRADSVKADVISTYDKGKGGAVLRRWLTKGDGISIHDAIAELQDQGILTDTDAKNEADMLIALNEEYERLKGLTELRREFIPLANIDKARLDEIQKNIEDIMLGFFRSGGKETKYSQLLRRYRALLSERDAKNQKELEELEAKLSERFTKRIDKMREEADRQMAKTKEFYDRRLTESQYAYRYAKKLTRIIADTRNLRDYVNRDYMPAEFMENPQTKGIAKAFLKAVSRTNVKVDEAKEAARIMLEWADNIKKTDETFIGGLGVGAMTQDEYDALSRVARSTSEISLEIEELEDFHTALQAAIRNYKSYDMLWDGERYVQIGEKAREAVEQQLRAKEESERDGWFAKMSRTIRKIGLQFLDPLSAAAAIDGYNYDGVFQELLSKLAYAEAEKNKMMGELRAPFEEFLKNHKKYEERLASEVIELTPEIKITVGQAITLSEMYKRDQAKAALAISRIAFNMDDGTVRKLEGYGETPFLSTPNGKKVEIDTAKEVRRVYYNNRANALAMLHEYGYDTSQREGAVAFEQFERDLAAAETEAMNVMRQFGDQRKQIIEDVAKQFTDEDREFIKLVSDFFQTTSKEAKKSADLRNLGYSNVIEGYYFPIKRRSADMAKNIADGSFFSDFITSANISFNHSTMQGAKASIDIFNVWDILTEHIEGLALWEHLYLPVQNINKIYNKNVATKTGPVTVKNILSERTDGDWGKWLADLLLDVQGARRKETKTTFDSLINWVRGKYAVYQLGLNPQTVVKQTLSWAAASQYISPASIAKGLLHPRLNHEQLNRVSAVAAERMDDATVIRAMSNTEKFSKAAEKTMWGITKMDRFVNEALFAMCQEEVAARNPAMPIGSEENLIEAGKLVSEVILKVQDSSDVMTKSQAARSSSELLKAFTMFQSAGIKMFSRIFENVGFVARYRTLSKADQAKYGAKYKQAQKQLAKSVGALSAVAVLTALIVQLFKSLYNKDREDKDGNEITMIEDFATDAATEIVGVVPIIGDIVDYYVNGYEVSNFFSDTFNDTLKAVGQVVSIGARAVGGDVIEDWEVGSMLRKVSRAAGSLTGIPVRNVENTLSGLVRRVAPEAGYSYDTLFYDPNYTEDVKKALNEGDTEMAAHIVELMMKRKKTGAKTYSAETINTLVDLRNVGYENVFPKTVKIDDMDRKTYKKFISVYGKADSVVDKLVTSEEFKAFADLGTDEASPQATAITTLYNAYFDLAEHDVLGEELTRGAAYVSVTDAHNLMLVKAYDKAIKLETVEVKGSRKAMLKAYMKELGMDKTAQAYAAYSCGFRTDDVKNIILADLKGKKDENELLIALGLKEAEEKEDAA